MNKVAYHLGALGLFAATCTSGLFALDYAFNGLRAMDRRNTVAIYSVSLDDRRIREYESRAFDSGMKAIGLGTAALYLSAVGRKLVMK